MEINFKNVTYNNWSTETFMYPVCIQMVYSEAFIQITHSK